jgi:hypothetical protein
MATSGMLHSCMNRRFEELGAYIIRVTRISELGTMLAVTSISSSEMSVLTRATQRNIPEDAILHSHCCENLKSYKSSQLSFPVLGCVCVFLININH